MDVNWLLTLWALRLIRRSAQKRHPKEGVTFGLMQFSRSTEAGCGDLPTAVSEN
jgi:hypothetical protein